jgi:outer membrane lipoprotein LolB
VIPGLVAVAAAFQRHRQNGRRSARALLLAGPLMLAGCATMTPPAAQAPGTSVPAATRAFHEAIEMGGRISVLYQAAGRDEGLHGNFTWSQSPGRTVVTLLSPLGQTLAVIDLTADRAILTQAGQPPQEASDADALAQRVLGWPLPVAGLRLWLQGVGRGADGQPFTAAPQSDSFTTADGWHLKYVSWDDAATPAPGAPGALPRPRRLDLQRTTREAGNVTLRLVLDTWQPEPAAP